MVAFTYISGRGREGAALGGAEGACCEHDWFCEGGIGGEELGICGYGLEREKGWLGRNGRESCWEIGTDRTMILLFAA